MKDDQPAIPCGLVAKSLFNDTFELIHKDGNDEHIIKINDNNIAWASDIDYKFKNTENTVIDGKSKTWKEMQWHDMTDRK